MTKPVFGFPTKRDSNQSPQLQRLASERNKFRLYTHQKVNNIGAHEILLMHMLVYPLCCSYNGEPQRQIFSRRCPNKACYHLTLCILETP